ncbi:hypothetical protein T4E_6916, partial [Trichinella pseudospiralis]
LEITRLLSVLEMLYFYAPVSRNTNDMSKQMNVGGKDQIASDIFYFCTSTITATSQLYYEKEILAYWLQEYSVQYDAIVVGSLETWNPKNDVILKRIGVVSERYLRLMKVLVVSEMLEHSS